MRSHSIPKKLDYQKILGKPRHTKKINSELFSHFIIPPVNKLEK